MAWEIIQQTPPVVVVTDLSLPRVDGYELIGRIRADERLRHIPVVALSGYTPKTMDTPEEGWDLELLKPCLPEDLMNAIVKLASGRKTMG
jgi:CheY-like chemotaxis protein